MAFTNPSAPSRVVFILTFCARPRFGNGELETRILSTGGSYSLHWSQWGHTVADFQKPLERMRQPWRTLRSMGIYKPASAQWGWDFFHQAWMRIVNEEAGYSRYDLDEFLKTGGFKWLPQQLQGKPSKENDSHTAWGDFALDTLHRCNYAFEKAYLVALGIYLVGVLGVNGLLFALDKRTRHDLTILQSFRRLVIMHGILLVMAWLSLYRISQTTWAEHIRSGQLYQLPNPSGEVLQATLPLDEDILVLDEYQSDYLGSYTRVLEVAHPGNRAWNELVASSVSGYNQLPSIMQAQLCSNMVLWSRQSQRRILTKNFQGDWAQLHQEQAERFCHEALLTESDPFVNEFVTQLDYLIAETKFGRLRETVMHGKTIPSYLVVLRRKVLHLPRTRASNSIRAILDSPMASQPFRLQIQSILPILKKSRIVPKRRVMPPSLEIQEPYLGAWLKGGDIVEACYPFSNGKWLVVVTQDITSLAFARSHHTLIARSLL
jgi:hypothetical protein